MQDFMDDGAALREQLDRSGGVAALSEAACLAALAAALQLRALRVRRASQACTSPHGAALLRSTPRAPGSSGSCPAAPSAALCFPEPDSDHEPLAFQQAQTRVP